jgi:hypothetical protein
MPARPATPGPRPGCKKRLGSFASTCKRSKTVFRFQAENQVSLRTQSEEDGRERYRCLTLFLRAHHVCQEELLNRLRQLPSVGGVVISQGGTSKRKPNSAPQQSDPAQDSSGSYLCVFHAYGLSASPGIWNRGRADEVRRLTSSDPDADLDDWRRRRVRLRGGAGS